MRKFNYFFKENSQFDAAFLDDFFIDLGEVGSIESRNN